MVRRSPVRSATDAAAETVALVLDESVPLPASQTDVDDLVARLRGHIVDLANLLVPGRLGHAPEQLSRAVVRADTLRHRPAPHDHVGSRIYLVRLAEVTQELASVASTFEVCSAEQPRVPDPEPPQGLLHAIRFATSKGLP
ncbi:DUF6415 family natural product biosynthesis protein [Streptomyces inhibens]|uniref:DUF6415 family natural product biosynthesis protein n=1 Tax=Streptomyces inhibens TaxID=2293571 RepID=UPI00402A95C7